jgi:hypothetical protein
MNEKFKWKKDDLKITLTPEEYEKKKEGEPKQGK